MVGSMAKKIVGKLAATIALGFICFLILCGTCLSKAILPIDGDICLTSSFGSWRRTHIHAGVDFSTGRKVSREIYAPDSCKVLRISVSSYGYGKALYLLLNNGMVAVYAHLSGFAPELESLVEASQDSAGTYEVDLFLKERNIRFQPGDIVAYSGETGAGPPHLHFEIRSDEGDSLRINPLFLYPELCDSFAPLIRTISLEPIGPNASINGRKGVLRLTRESLPSVIRLSGRVGVSVEALDPVGCGNHLLPHRYELAIDGVTVWRLAFDRFPFSLRHFVDAIYEPLGTRRFVRLYPINDIDYLDFKGSSTNLISGPYDPTPGPHSLSVRVYDFWGNCDSVSIDAICERKPLFLGFDLFEKDGSTLVKVRGESGSRINLTYSILGSGLKKALTSVERFEGLLTDDTRPVEVISTIEDAYGFSTEGYFSTCPHRSDDRCDLRIQVKPTFLELVASCTTPPRSLPVALINKPVPTSVTLQPVGRNKFVGWAPTELAEEATDVTVGFEYVNGWLFCKQEIDQFWISPGRQLEFEEGGLKVILSNPKDGGFGCFLSVDFIRHSSFENFEPDGIMLVFEPKELIFPKGVDILVSGDNRFDLEGACIYSLEGGLPYFLSNFDQSGCASFRVYKLNRLVVLRDLQPPILTFGSIRLRKDGKAIFTGTAYDKGSGIDPKSLTAYIDDEKAIVGIDPDTGRLDGRSTNRLPYGKHRVRLDARDRAGNRKVVETVVNLIR